MTYRVLDLTDLREKMEESDVIVLCRKANQNINWVKAVCLPAKFLSIASERLPSSTAIATVFNFPDGNKTAPEIEQEIAKYYGVVHEYDVVLPLHGSYLDQIKFIRRMRKATEGFILKIILETAIRSLEEIDAFTSVCINDGVDFVKTSTGKREGACIRDVSVILNRLYATKFTTGIKISGGVKRYAQFNEYVEIARMFKCPITPTKFRVGASTLLDDLINFQRSEAA